MVVGAGVWEAVDGMGGVLGVSMIVIYYNIKYGEARLKCSAWAKAVAGSRLWDPERPQAISLQGYVLNVGAG
jgi:hypothetical protein